jgi:topoisomerase-4 subunit A
MTEENITTGDLDVLDESAESQHEVIGAEDSQDGNDGDGGSNSISMEDYDTSDGSIRIAAFAQRAYLSYAMAVVKGRALPSIEDGQKLVQRRILFAMKELGNWHESPYKKSARIVGDVIGKYHPHGDTSVYEAAVRMAQDFTLRYPLIDGQGNFGSRDGDTAAAMRYTEIRLTRFAEEILLADMDRGTVDFSLNYDGQLEEPKLMPARLPMLLLNGAMGIAVGMATDIPSHNIREVANACCALLESQNSQIPISDDQILDFIQGPDFSGGGQVISSAEEIRRAYSTGRGSLRVRARWAIEPLAKGQWQIAITELPPCSFDSKDLGDTKVTGSARILAEIDELLSPKIEKGKKVINAKQHAIKTSILSLLEKARDDSDKKHPIRIILEPRSSKVSPDELMSLLLANTALEGNIKVNLVSIGRNGQPLQRSFPTMLREWSGFRLDILERRLKFRYEEVNRRLHILNGRMIAFLNIDKIIKVIRESDDPKSDLITAFSLTEIQAEDILEIRLRQLARLEGIKIEQEIAKLKDEKASLEELLGSEIKRRILAIEEIRKDSEKYGDNRRTLIEHSEKVTLSKVDIIVDEPLTIILSKNGYIRSRNGHGLDNESLTWKAGDSRYAILETRSTYPIIILDSTGRSYSLKSTDLPGGKGDGVPVASLIDLGNAKIVAMLSSQLDRKVLISTAGSFAFICKISDMISKQKAGKRFLNVIHDEKECEILPPAYTDGCDKLLAISSDFRMLSFPISEIKEADGGKGVIVMGMNDNDTLLHCVPYKDSITIKGRIKSGKSMEFTLTSANDAKWSGKRTKKGCNLPVNFVALDSVE